MKGNLKNNRYLKSVHPLVLQLYDAYLEDPKIDEIGFVMQPLETSVDAKQREIAAVIVAEHKLGIVSWAIPTLYEEAKNGLFSLRNQKATHLDIHDYEVANACLSTTILLLNPDFNLAWNVRKSLLVPNDNLSYRNKSKETVLNEELQFVALILSRHPKSSMAWAHRSWVINELVKNICKNERRNLALRERFVIERALQKHPRCYYALLHKLLLLNSSGVDLNEELRYTYLWLSRHVSDHSAISYLEQVVLKILLSKRMDGCTERDRFEFLQAQVCAVNSFLVTYPYHESLWLFKRFLMSHIVQDIKQSSQPTDFVLSLQSDLYAHHYSTIQSKQDSWWMEIPEYVNDFLSRPSSFISAQIKFSFDVLVNHKPESGTEIKSLTAPLSFLVCLGLTYLRSNHTNSTQQLSIDYDAIFQHIKGAQLNSNRESALEHWRPIISHLFSRYKIDIATILKQSR